MTDSQEEKIKRLFKGAGYTMDEAAKKLKITRATLYNKINKHPLNTEFIQNVKTHLRIDLYKMESIDTKKPDQNDLAEENKKLKEENARLKDELLQFLRQALKKK